MKSRYIKISALFILMGISIHTIGQKQTRNVEPFTGISMGISANLYLKTGEKHQVVLEGDEDVLERIETNVRNGRLVIESSTRNWWRNFKGNINIYVSAYEIDYLSLSGSGKIIGENTLQNENLKLSVSGSGDLQLNIMVNKLKQDISGSGDTEISGKADDVVANISGSGSLDGENLLVQSLDIGISGSGKCKIHVDKELNTRISGSGSIYYKGDPKIRSSISGSGKLRPL